MANLLETDNISGSGWAVNTNALVTANYANAPDGTLTATRLIDDVGGGSGNVQTSNTVTGLALSSLHICHGFFKSDQLTSVRLQVGALSALDLYHTISTVDGSTIASGADNIAEGSEEYQDNWWFNWFTFNTDGVDANGSVIVRVTNTTVDLDGTSSILVAGVQLEAGGTATPSYELDFGEDPVTGLIVPIVRSIIRPAVRGI